LPWVGRRTRLQQRTRRPDEAERRRLGRGGKLGASEAVMVEFAVELEQPIHRLPIALPSRRHHGDAVTSLRLPFSDVVIYGRRYGGCAQFCAQLRKKPYAPVAQLDRVSVFETEGWRFEPFRARQQIQRFPPYRIARFSCQICPGNADRGAHDRQSVHDEELQSLQLLDKAIGRLDSSGLLGSPLSDEAGLPGQRIAGHRRPGDGKWDRWRAANARFEAGVEDRTI
jgi:hypothetical protein